MIPKVLHRIWLGGPMPDIYDHGDAWRRALPDWEHRLWTQENLDGQTWSTRTLMDRAEELAPDDSIRFRADVWRVEIVHRFGGVYIDCDTAPLRPLDPLLSHPVFLVRSPSDEGLVCNSPIGAVPDHPFLEALLSGFNERALATAGLPLHLAVGGAYLTALLPDHPDVHVLPWWTFTSRSPRARDRGLKPDPRNLETGYADHLWGNTHRLLHRSRIPMPIRRAKWALEDRIARRTFFHWDADD